ncbi:MAG: hypothetical protein WBD22_03125 [Pyrinomonadaceae bacterium]
MKLTTSGAAFGAAISPDGKYAAYQTMAAGKYSIWLMDLGSKSSVQITPPGANVFSGIAFSPGDENIYYVSSDNQLTPISSVYRMPRLGGESKKVLVGTNSPVGFSPNGSQFTFIRQDLEKGETLLMIAKADGTDERELAKRKSPDSFSTGKRPAWSPDGKTIAVIGINSSEKFLRVLTVNVTDGTVQPLTSEQWSALQDVVWSSDSDNILMTAQDDIKFGPLQIWRTSLSGAGEAEKLTHELISYVGLSFSADSGFLLTTQTDPFSDIWVAPSQNDGSPKQILSIKGGGRVEISWTPDGRIVFTSNASGDPNIFVMNADGTNQIQLTADNYPKRSPVVSPDGRSIVFVSNQSGPEQLWRMDIDGQNQRQLAADHVYRYPQFSPDGDWIVYSTWQDKQAFLWKVPFNGGDKIMLNGGTSWTPNVSPDMRSAAYMEKNVQPGGGTRINIVSLTSDEPLKSFEVPASTLSDSIRWSPDGRGVFYRSSKDNAANFYLQPIGESEPRQLTDFKYDFPVYCALSRDMKQISCLRGIMIRDAVLFSPPG